MDSDDQSSYERERVDKRHLPRLSPEHYTGHAIVHWTLTIENRTTGWLTAEFHQAWKFILLHTCSRYDLCSPVYVLMKDHIHLILMGLNADGSHQRTALEFLRKHLRPQLAPAQWQNQAHDHVLREPERKHGAFQTIAQYIMDNPIRAGLADTSREYLFLGCSVSGYPELNLHQDDYWPMFWRIYERLTTTRSRSQPQING